jgi:hypothetical protein
MNKRKKYKKYKKYKKKSTKWKSEEICRNILQDIFDLPFLSVRPDFLKNPSTNCNLEIDCYNSSIKLGLEYNGIQHYEYPNKWHKNLRQFKKQKNNDELKIKLCQQQGIILIIVPYTIKNDCLYKYIYNKILLYENLVKHISSNIK